MQIKTNLRHAAKLATIGFALQLAGCGGGDGSGAPAPQGAMHVALTNTGAAACGYQQVNVTIATVGANTNPTAPLNASDGSWKRLVLDIPMSVELLALISNSPKELATVTLPAGHYSQISMRLEENIIWGKPASVVLPDNQKVALNVGTAASAGISIAHEFDVPANGQVNLLLDFDACSSVVDAGNGNLTLTPVITVR